MTLTILPFNSLLRDQNLARYIFGDVEDAFFQFSLARSGSPVSLSTIPTRRLSILSCEISIHHLKPYLLSSMLSILSCEISFSRVWEKEAGCPFQFSLARSEGPQPHLLSPPRNLLFQFSLARSGGMLRTRFRNISVLSILSCEIRGLRTRASSFAICFQFSLARSGYESHCNDGLTPHSFQFSLARSVQHKCL